MIIDIKVPVLPESVSEATLVTWNKKVGDFVNRDENLIDVETDKVVLELPSPDSGVITEILIGDGENVVAEQIIAKLDTAAKASAGATATSGVTESEKSIPSSSETKSVASGISMPSATKLAADKDISLSGIQGTGKDGRILKEDVLSATKTVTPPQPVLDTFQQSGERPEQRIPMTRLRKTIADRLLQSKNENAILTTFNEVNMQPVIDLRNKYKDKFLKTNDVKLGFMSFFVKAAVTTLKRYPVVNASIDGTDIVYHGYFDIGIAVSSPRGLVVPIIRNADEMSFAEIEKQIADYAAKAQTGKLSVEDMTGGTFSITNGGTFGSLLSTPIINPPQSAILGMHATKERAVVENGQVVARPMMYLALSYDHRLIDGKDAVLTLVSIKDLLEDPARLILDI